MDDNAWPPGTEILHIIPQGEWHDPSWIIGTRSAITALRDALTAALVAALTEEGRTQPIRCSAMTNDGEGYRVICRVMTERAMEDVPFGYVSELARGRGTEFPIWMWEGVDDA